MDVYNSSSQSAVLQAIQSGPIASLPASGGTSQILYICTDSPYHFVWNGSAWIAYAFGFQMVPPVLANFTQMNVDDSTFDTSHGGIGWITPTKNNSTDTQVIGMAPGLSTPYFVDAAFMLLCGQPSGGPGIGFAAGLTGSSKFEHSSFGYGNAALYGYEVLFMTNPTTFSSSAGSWDDVVIAPLLWMRIKDDGTNLTYYNSINGYDWDQRYQHARTSFLTPSDVCMVVVPTGATNYVHWLHWSIHN